MAGGQGGEKYVAVAEKAVKYFADALEADGSFGAGVTDIACYFKAPMMFIRRGDSESATKVLSYIDKRFVKEDGDCGSDNATKSIKGEYGEFWSYINGWVARAALAAKYSPDVTARILSYMSRYHVGAGLGFLTHRVGTGDGITDVLTAAHHGLVHLEAGNTALAESAGTYLLTVLRLNQPHIQQGHGCFYLRCDARMNLVVEDSPFHRVKQSEGGQLYFMLGYPAAFLALLSEEAGMSGADAYLRGARGYMSVVEGCGSAVWTSMWSHKVAWAASVLHRITGEAGYLALVGRVVDYMVGEQDGVSGLWYQPATDDIGVATALDQSAEIAGWLLAIYGNGSHSHCSR